MVIWMRTNKFKIWGVNAKKMTINRIFILLIFFLSINIKVFTQIDRDGDTIYRIRLTCDDVVSECDSSLTIEDKDFSLYSYEKNGLKYNYSLINKNMLLFILKRKDEILCEGVYYLSLQNIDIAAIFNEDGEFTGYSKVWFYNIASRTGIWYFNYKEKKHYLKLYPIID